MGGKYLLQILFVYMCLHLVFIIRQSVGWSPRADALCCIYSLQKYLERLPGALYEAGQSVLMLRMGSKIPRNELSTVHLYQYYSMLMPKKLQYT
jgi:hypothetical protein